MKWQSMSTAPLDGTKILLAIEGGVWVGAWEPHHDASYPAVWKAQDGSTLVRPWKDDAEPLYWMPLPALPSGFNAEEKP